MTVQLHYDVDADAAYLRFSENAVSESEEVLPGVVFDYDADGRMVGLEILDAHRRLPADMITQ